MCNEIRKSIRSIIENYKIIDLLIGHGNIMLKINTFNNKKEICKIILEITELFNRKNIELVEFIGIDNINNLYVKPKNMIFDKINKKGSQVKWNKEFKYIYSYIKVMDNWNLTLEDIVEAIYKEYNIILNIDKEILNNFNKKYFGIIYKNYTDDTNGT
jgi:hypothetical protein